MCLAMKPTGGKPGPLLLRCENLKRGKLYDFLPASYYQMKSQLLTVIPVYNGEPFLAQTLESVARQQRRPDRVVVLDNCSTDRTEEIVRNFAGIPCEFIRNPKNIGLFGNLNRSLDFSTETEFLQILHADDVINPDFYEVMIPLLQDCPGRGMAWSLDERIDENNRHLSYSGKADGEVEILAKDVFLQRKAELSNQSFCAVLLKTGGQPAPCRFREDFPILGDTIFWAAYGLECDKLVHVRRRAGEIPMAWRQSDGVSRPGFQPLILDEWRTWKRTSCCAAKAGA